jgi:hypothetical protein
LLLSVNNERLDSKGSQSLSSRSSSTSATRSRETLLVAVENARDIVSRSLEEALRGRALEQMDVAPI